MPEIKTEETKYELISPCIKYTDEMSALVRKMKDYGKELSKLHLLDSYPDGNGSNGNLSVRISLNSPNFLITARGLPSKHNLRKGDFVLVEEWIPEYSRTNTILYSGYDPITKKPRKPSSETPLHIGIYVMKNAGAVVHAHAPKKILYEAESIWGRYGFVETKTSLKGLESTFDIVPPVEEILDFDACVIMKGHGYAEEDVGLVSIGKTLDEAAQKIIERYRALLKAV